MDYESYIKGKAIDVDSVTVPEFDKVMFEQAVFDYFKDFADEIILTQHADLLANQIELTIKRKGEKYSGMFYFHDDRELKNLYHRFENIKGKFVRDEVHPILEHIKSKKAAD